MNKKLIGAMAIMLALASLLNSCTQEEHSEQQILTDCQGIICSIELDNVDLLRYTNVVGKSVDKVLKQEAVSEPEYNITWVMSDGQFATDQQLSDNDLATCNGDCTYDSNPTSWIFNSVGSHQIGISGTLTNPDGSIEKIDLVKTVNINYGKAKIESEVMGGSVLDYKFIANITDTGIPDDATFTWKVDGTEIGTGQEIDYLFPNVNTAYNVTLEVSVNGEVVTTSTKNITTGTVVAPRLSSSRFGFLDYSLSVDLAGTGITDAWTLQWSSNPSSAAFSAPTSAYTNVTFDNYNTTYTVTLTATPPGGSGAVAAAIPINTGDAFVPTMTMVGGNYSQIAPSGVGEVTGITWVNTGSAITFTCPSGYGILASILSPTPGNKVEDSYPGRDAAFFLRQDGGVYIDDFHDMDWLGYTNSYSESGTSTPITGVTCNEVFET
ncbi:uncharacterized protein DUF3281 [Allofrancisella inopinata]|uniref:DUF3281 domain-containing protein n=1 Tax=Allofrancisella inopinata TaxID=1085647 RepID=A0AAE7CS65_9GAMM|nr:DUF3281 family protein [Allofrancisella inopinata]QIV96408.1 DUF3281 domain-containing protein [Allofrancisella inopinata]TDT73391.1 uncharacterized protein DUF3281 [Allofrancisella inopinata]